MLGTFLRSFRWGHTRQLDRVSREVLMARLRKGRANPPQADSERRHLLRETVSRVRRNRRRGRPLTESLRRPSLFYGVQLHTGELWHGRGFPLKNGKVRTKLGRSRWEDIMSYDLSLVRQLRREASWTLKNHIAPGDHERAAALRAEIAGFDTKIDAASEAWMYLGLEVPAHQLDRPQP